MLKNPVQLPALSSSVEITPVVETPLTIFSSVIVTLSALATSPIWKD